MEPETPDEIENATDAADEITAVKNDTVDEIESETPKVVEQTHSLDHTDISLLWANNTDAVKNDLDVEFFLFNKNYTPV